MRRRDPPPRLHASPSPIPRAPSVNWVAIIDDHASLRESLARALRGHGIAVELFESAEAFLAHRSTTSPRCLVLDMQMPGMGGHELVHYLDREQPPCPPTIFITGHDEVLSFPAFCCVSHGRLRKPFEISDLLTLLAARMRTDAGVLCLPSRGRDADGIA